MKSINFLQVILVIAAAGALHLHSSFPVCADARQCVGKGENSIWQCGGNCCIDSSGIEQCGGETATGKEECSSHANKKKPEAEEKPKDFCRLKDLR